MIRIGNFEFSKPPDIFQNPKGLFFIAGSLPNHDHAKHLREVLDSNTPLDFQHGEMQTLVLVGDTKFISDAIWGERYELLLYEYNPLELTRRKISTGEVENIGERTVSPRFRIIVEQANWKESLPLWETLDYEVKLRVDLSENTESFKLLFKDQFPADRRRHNFSRWTTSPELSVKVLLGYLEQGDLLPVFKGKVTRISHGIVASGNWVKLEGKGELRERTQESVYLIKEGANLIAGRLERTEHGSLMARIKTVLLPDLRPKDSVDVCSKNLGIEKVETAKVDSVTHIFDLSGSFTQFRFVL
jgi:hypothetical protein